MRIEFERVVIHNFLSIGDADLRLNNNSIVMVEGRNNNELEQSYSNGSGKSSIFNAICWALTGETIQGVSSDVVNIYATDGCWVKLEMRVNGDAYEITRLKDDKKSDMKIFKNGEDKSGKGIRESSKVLETLFPDLTGDLIGSIIVLGQGLPHRFSNNTPAGRKEILERLSKSDFMIEDLKNRLNMRREEIDSAIRQNEDNRLKEETVLGTYLLAIEDGERKLKELQDCGMEDTTPIEGKIGEAEKRRDELGLRTKTFDDVVEAKTRALLNLTNDKNVAMSEAESELKDKLAKLDEELAPITNELKDLDFQIAHANDDICPTCGQRIPNKQHVDVEPLLARKDALLLERDRIGGAQEAARSGFNEKKQSIEKTYDLAAINNAITEMKTLRQSAQNELNEVVAALGSLNNLLLKARYRNQTYNDSIKQLEDAISLNQARKQASEEKIVYYNERETELLEHSDVLNQMSTIVKRDFRGYLLSNVIDFINAKANDYAEVVFENRLINFSLNGNNIDIGFNGKPYENLSGGEKQKVDLILQFAIKDMLNLYLDVHCNILVLDEIFDNLDVVGCNKVLNLISELGDIDSVYIISHHADELKIPYDMKIRVVKDSSGISSIVV